MKQFAWMLLLAACGDGGTETFTLTVTRNADLSVITGNGISCGTNPTCGQPDLATCAIPLDAGTHVTLTIMHPICPPGGNGGIYSVFGWRGGCDGEDFHLGTTCELDLAADTIVNVSGASALD